MDYSIHALSILPDVELVEARIPCFLPLLKIREQGLSGKLILGEHFASELRPRFYVTLDTVKGFRNPLYIDFC